MKKLIKNGLIFLIAILISLELILRLLGYKPYHQITFSIVSSPHSTLTLDEKLGYKLRPGLYKTTINDSLEYQSTHLKDSTRTTGFIKDTLPLPEIHFHGCSFTYGMGVNDDQTFAYILQQKLNKEYKIINHGVPGYGNIQGYLQTMESKNKNTKSVFAFYADFHNARNVLNSSYRSHLNFGLQTLKDQQKKGNFPFAQIENDSLFIYHRKSNSLYKKTWFRDYSALANLIQEVRNQIADKNINEQETTIKIFEQWNKYCQLNNIEFCVVALLDNKESKKTIQLLKDKNINTIDIGLDILGNNKYNFLPYDSHPNQQAHQIYAEKLYQYLNPYLIH